MNINNSEASYEAVKKAVDYIRTRSSLQPKFGIVCGSGLGGIGNLVTDCETIKYSDIPGFHVSTVKGHKGQMLLGKLNGVDVCCLQGRVHGYEGISFKKVAFPIRCMKLLGVEYLLTTAAAGALNSDYKLGDFMILQDHLPISMWSCNNPLTGPNDDKFGPRFPSMTDAYDRDMIKTAQSVMSSINQSSTTRLGVYAQMPGPCYETVAEIRMLRIFGCDVSGMSIAPEVTVARHCGIKCFGISMVTNICVQNYESEEVANHAEVIEVANQRAKDMETFFVNFVKKLDDQLQN